MQQLQEAQKQNEAVQVVQDNNYVETEQVQEQLLQKYQKALEAHNSQQVVGEKLPGDEAMEDLTSTTPKLEGLKHRLRWDEVKMQVHGSPSKLRRHGDKDNYDQ